MLAMNDGDGQRSEDLEQQLLDERRERDAAQRRAAELSERVDLWRGRAEERSARITKLEAERDRLRGPAGLLRRVKHAGSAPAESSSVGPDALSEPTALNPPTQPSIRCVAIVENEDLEVASRMFDSVRFGESVSLMEADVVLADAGGIGALSTDARAALEAWATLDVRPQLVVTDDVEGQLASRANAVVARRDLSGRFFEPSVANPSVRKKLVTDELGDLSTIDVDGFGPVAVSSYDVSSTTHLKAAAMGIPFIDPGTDLPNAEDLLQRGVQYRRFAFERRADQLRRFSKQLLLDAPSATSRVAGIFVSSRPDLARRAIKDLANQEYPNLEMVVGCHRFRSTEIAEAVDVLSGTFNVQVLEFGDEMSLGQCLNRAISSTGADLLAKFDDDDHYGPAYVVDAVQAFEYSQADVVGKGASFVFVESEDRTVLRRAGTEETFYNGSPTGATLVWTRSLWEKNPFAHRTVGEDLAFLRGARRLDQSIYVNSPFDFVYHRRRSGNTWQASDALFTEGAQPAWDGDRPWLADVPGFEPGGP